MLLAIDIGNTNIVLGVFDGATLGHSWRLATARERTADELGLLVTRAARARTDPALSTHRRRRAGVGRAAADRAHDRDGRAVPRARAAERRSRRSRLGHADSVRAPVRGRRRPHRQRHRGLRSVRPRAPAAAHRGATSARRRRSTRSRRRASTSAASSARASRFRPTRCSSAPRGCRASTSASRRSVIGRTTVTSMQSGLFFGYVGMVEGWCTGCGRNSAGRRTASRPAGWPR